MDARQAVRELRNRGGFHSGPFSLESPRGPSVFSSNLATSFPPGRFRRWLLLGLLSMAVAFLPRGALAQQTSGESGEPTVYTYNDGDRTLKVVLQEDLVLTRAGASVARLNDALVRSGDTTNPVKPGSTDSTNAAGAVLARVGDAVILRIRSAEDEPSAVSSASSALIARPADALPVFRSPGGTLMALPGGVIVIFDEGWDSSRAMRVLIDEGITPDRISPMLLDGAYLIETAPGFPSLELANRLAGVAGVFSSSPNWWREVALF